MLILELTTGSTASRIGNHRHPMWKKKKMMMATLTMTLKKKKAKPRLKKAVKKSWKALKSWKKKKRKKKKATLTLKK